MAEAYVKSLYPGRFQAFSAGTEPTALNPAVAAVMAEEGIDLTGHKSKNVSEFAGREFDYVVTVCDQAQEACPYFPGGGKRWHRGFADPSRCSGEWSEVLACVRRIRDEIRNWLVGLWGEPARQDGPRTRKP
ncbi:MAG: arsenate reductase ArsC [Candidatus Aminicenantes bacterium]|nr:arsenate reductase ArsC [Candidatus Aminicenantes bacterium]